MGPAKGLMKLLGIFQKADPAKGARDTLKQDSSTRKGPTTSKKPGLLSGQHNLNYLANIIVKTSRIEQMISPSFNKKDFKITRR